MNIFNLESDEVRLAADGEEEVGLRSDGEEEVFLLSLRANRQDNRDSIRGVVEDAIDDCTVLEGRFPNGCANQKIS